METRPKAENQNSPTDRSPLRGVIEVFPAIPVDWKDISFMDLRAMGAFIVSAEMKDGEVVSLSVHSEKGGLLKIRSPKDGNVVTKETNPGETVNII